MRRTDKGKIFWPKGTSHTDRSFCRKIINTVKDRVKDYDFVLVSYSTGMDSTVLAHALSKAMVISGQCSRCALFYINHMIRAEVDKEVDFVKRMASELDFDFQVVARPILRQHDNNLQADAREMRYEALRKYAHSLGTRTNNVAVLTAHHANDEAETKLFKLLTGRGDVGIAERIEWLHDKTGEIKLVDLLRPLLSFTREDLRRYAEVWDLQWCEDSSNQKLDYTRNKIRHELIPWIETNINPAVIKTLSRKAE